MSCLLSSLLRLFSSPHCGLRHSSSSHPSLASRGPGEAPAGCSWIKSVNVSWWLIINEEERLVGVWGPPPPAGRGKTAPAVPCAQRNRAEQPSPRHDSETLLPVPPPWPCLSSVTTGEADGLAALRSVSFELNCTDIRRSKLLSWHASTRHCETEGSSQVLIICATHKISEISFLLVFNNLVIWIFFVSISFCFTDLSETKDWTSIYSVSQPRPSRPHHLHRLPLKDTEGRPNNTAFTSLRLRVKVTTGIRLDGPVLGSADSGPRIKTHHRSP